MAGSDRLEQWSGAEAYEQYAGRWSRPVAIQFLRWLRAPRDARWLDVGGGTGALSSTVVAHALPSRVLGVDRSLAYLAHARGSVADARVSFAACDASRLPVRDGGVDVAVSGLALNFVGDAAAATSEMARAVRAGGLVAGYVWDYAGGMQFMRHFWDAAGALDAAAASLDQGQRFPLCAPDRLEALFRQAGLTDVRTTGVTVRTAFADFDDYWLPFLGGQGAAPTYVASLSASHQTALRERLRGQLPRAADGGITLTARAWAVAGRVP